MEGNYTLTALDKRAPVGNYASLLLNRPLKKGVTYMVSMKFKLSTDSNAVNFHIKDSGSKLYQVIYSYKVSDNINDWIDLSFDFIPNSNVYDAFMIGASQISGEDNYISFAHINII